MTVETQTAEFKRKRFKKRKQKLINRITKENRNGNKTQNEQFQMSEINLHK